MVGFLEFLITFVSIPFLIICGCCGILFLFNFVAAKIAADALSELPEEHRKLDPRFAYLLLIPFLNVMWNFVLWPSVSRSYRSFFECKGFTQFGDCGEFMMYWYGVAPYLMFIPLRS